MEKLESMVPKSLQRQIAESLPDDLASTCSSLLNFFIYQPLFHQIVGDLTDPETALCRKNKEAAVELKNKGNICYSREDYSTALSIYSKALRVVPVDAEDNDRNLAAVLYVNRATVLHKMGLQAESLRDCNRAIVLSPTYAKAWYKRGKANIAFAHYDDAKRDFDVTMNLEPSSSRRRQIEEEWNLISLQQKMSRCSMNKPEERRMDSFHAASPLDELQPRKVQCVSTPTKGRGMATVDEIPQASLVHSEEPYAAIILKSCRESHCHFCLNELPLDIIPCSSCSIPVYCSQQCQELAGGKIAWNNTRSCDIIKTLSDEVKMYIRDITTPKLVASDIHYFSEHKHECGGVHWPAVLPAEIVLAARILVKAVEQQRQCSPGSSLTGIMDLSHNYEQLLPARKLELHVSSIILLYCLQQSYSLEFPKNGDTVSKFVILLSQIRVNSMAIVRMMFRDHHGQIDLSGKYSPVGEVPTSTLEQVKVGQAVYSVGSLFNHSCRPNIHAYFLSRTLFVRSTEFVGPGCPLELSYGPQVGEWDCRRRREVLEVSYSFRCGCRGCSEINFPDMVLNAFRCAKPNCFGVVLDSWDTQCENEKISSGVRSNCALQQADMGKYGEIYKVASRLLLQGNGSYSINPGECLSCGSYCDLEGARTTACGADISMKRLKCGIGANEVLPKTLSDALVSLDQLRSKLHAYNKRVAELEDNLAHALCLAGKLQLAAKHCKASLQILEKLYGHDHIAIGNELLKLSSIQLALGDLTAVESINHVSSIFSRYYGSHTNLIFPSMQGLDKEAHELAQRKGLS